MDLTFGSYRFIIDKEGSYRLSVPIFSGPSVVAPEDSTSSASSADTSNSSPSCTNVIDNEPLANLFGDMTFGSPSRSDLPRQRNFIDSERVSQVKFTASKEVITDLFDGVACPSQSIWFPNLVAAKENQVEIDPDLFDSADSGINTSNPTSPVITDIVPLVNHHIYVIQTPGSEVPEESESFDPLGNPLVDLMDLTKGTGPKYETDPPRQKTQLSQAAWDRAREALTGAIPMTTQATAEELTAYQYKPARTRRDL